MHTLPNFKPTGCGYCTLNCRGRLVALDVPKVMGVLNVTPDSFFDGGQYSAVDNALAQTEKMLAEGAAFIDIGGYSTRPGAADVDTDEELRRTIPIIEALLKHFPDALISIDTFRAAVAKEAVDAGAAIINDISAGDDDAEMIEVVVRYNVPYILMHKQGSPQTMQQNPHYSDVVKEVLDYLAKKVVLLRNRGVHDIIIDPGFGFGKTVEHNYALLRHLYDFRIINAPLLAGISRKSMINRVLGTKPENALNGTTAANTIALLHGASILRVHDVKEAVQAVKIVEAYKAVDN